MLSLTVPLVLASASPRRRHLLSTLGLSPTVRPTDADETWPQDAEPGDGVEQLAARKAALADDQVDAQTGLVLAADTIVVLDGEILGKPRDAAHARDTLGRLSGRRHTVYTGFSMRYQGRRATDHRATEVQFAPLRPDEIDRYVATGSPLDKAGAYGIQDDLGALLVERIDGDYTNVVGLPLRAVYEMLRDLFADLLV